MITIQKPRKKINYLFLICFMINISFSIQSYITYNFELEISESELGILFINSYNDLDLCEKWTPALSIPILLVPSKTDLFYLEEIDKNLKANNIVFSEYPLNIILFFAPKFLERYNKIIVGKEILSRQIQYCYFGLSLGNGNFSNLYENETLLYRIKNNNEIDKKIFSFDKWSLNRNSISTKLYFGDIHDNFNSKNGIIGTCNINKEEPLWGCSFQKMIINNKIVSLKNEDDKYYNISFVTENYNIIFPISFKAKFMDAINNGCISDDDNYLYCKNLFNNNNYIPITFINDNMNITAEIDSIIRFSLMADENKKYITRIKFYYIDYIVLPLIMFKNFHVQFDGENKKISFHTTDESILKLKKKKKMLKNQIMKVFPQFF